MMIVSMDEPAHAATAKGTTAVKTQLEPSPKISGVKPLAWIPAKTKLTLQCLAVGEKAYGALAKADPYYYKVSYKGKTGYAIDADLRTSKSATKLGLTYCSIPGKPTSPSVSSKLSSSVKLSWKDKSNNETSFRTQYSTNGGKSWKAGPKAKANAKSVTITGLKSSTKYTFQVGASNNKGTRWSAYVAATTAKPTKNIASGRCDYVKKGSNYVRSVGKGKALGTYTLNGWKIAVCGPRPEADKARVWGGRGVNPFGTQPKTSDLDGYQCTELSARWLYYAYGTKYSSGGAYSGGNGKEVVNKYAKEFPKKFVKYSNAKTHRPVSGDVISFNPGSKAGHVGIVYKVEISSKGTGSVQVLEQNSGRKGGEKGKSVYSVKNWKIEQAVNWLHKK